MSAIIGSLRADLSASIAQFQTDMGKAGDAVEQFAKRAKTVSRDLGRVGQELTLELTAPLVAFATAAGKAAADVQDATGQITAALASMGNHSGKSLEDLQAQAKALMETSLFNKTDILRSVTANMLAFGNISGKTFDRAQQAAVNLATRLKEDLQSATMQVGKALNNPIAGVQQLTRAGVQFTTAQKKQITALVRAGEGYKAQGIILDKLEQQFGGAGKAALDASPKGQLIHAWDELKESIGAIVLQYLPPLIKFLDMLIARFEALTPATQKMVVFAAGIVALVGPLLVIIATVLRAGVTFAEVFGEGGLLADSIAVIGDVGAAIAALGAVIVGPIAVAVGAVVAALVAFKSVVAEWVAGVVKAFQQGLGQDVPKLLAAFEGLFAALSTGPVGDFFKTVGYLIAQLVSGGLALLVVALLNAVDAITRGITAVVQVITDLVKVVDDVLSGDWASAWTDAGKAVSDFGDGIIGVLNAILPGVGDWAKNLVDVLTTFVVDGVKGILDWFSQAWAMLPDWVKAAAIGAGAWAKTLFDNIKTWLVDNLGPAVKWALDRLADLAAFFGKLTGAAKTALNPPKAVAPPKPPPPPAPPKPVIAPVFDQGTAKKQKDKVAQATKEYAKALQGLNDQISKGLDEQELPKAMAKADELRNKIDELTATAKKAGVGVGAFAGQIALMRAQIDKLETEGLQKEAEKFATEVNKETIAVNEFAKGGLAPLDAALQSVDDKYASLKQSITDQIDANAVLADHNATAAAAMVKLKQSLTDLEKAHTAATEAAKAQYAAEQNIANLQAAGQNIETTDTIRDLKQNSGQAGKFNTSQQDAVQAQEDSLAKQRIAAATQLAELQAKYDDAQRVGDTDSMGRLQTQIGLQQQLLTEVNSVTGAQMEAASQAKQAWQQFADQLADTLADVIVNWNGDLNSIRDVFKQLAKQLFLEPFLKGVTGALSGVLQNGFSGFHAKGGVIKKGQWGIVGEKGPEPIYANTDLTVVPNGGMGGGGSSGSPTVVFNVTTPDANSFRKNARQLARQAKQQLSYA